MNAIPVRLMAWMRTLHVYLSMLGLILIFFFSSTGFLMNHQEWFENDAPNVKKVQATLPAQILAGPDKLAIAEKLRADFRARGAISTFDVQDEQIQVIFKSPGRSVEAVINRADGKTEISYETRGLVGRLADLHKGASTGPGWQRLIDAVAIVLMISALTGVALWLSMPHRHLKGLAALAASLAICLAVYLLLVP